MNFAKTFSLRYFFMFAVSFLIPKMRSSIAERLGVRDSITNIISRCSSPTRTSHFYDSVAATESDFNSNLIMTDIEQHETTMENRMQYLLDEASSDLQFLKQMYCLELDDLHVDENSIEDSLKKARDLHLGKYKCAENTVLALQLYIECARLMSGHAMNNIGILYAKGDAVELNYRLAKDWFELALDSSYTLACTNIGILEVIADECAIYSPVEAAQYFSKTAVKSDPVAENNLACLYACGLGIEKNCKLALKYFKKASHNTKYNVVGVYNLAVLTQYLEGGSMKELAIVKCAAAAITRDEGALVFVKSFWG